MCGGIASALQLGGANSPVTALAFHGGRLASYATLGAIMGLLAGTLEATGWTMGLRYLAGALLIGMGLYIGDWWRGMALLERAGGAIFSPVQRLGASLMPLERPERAFALGMCWGLIPCGLIYSSLAWSATTQSPAQAALLMLLFGIGTLPAMLAVSLGAGRLQAFLRRRGLKWLIGALLVASGVWTIYLAAGHAQHAGHGTQHQGGAPPAHMDHSHH